MKKQLKKTKDGSHTFYVPNLNEHYHSTNGAITESKHIFIEAGLNVTTKNSPSVFELGFGTGLNAYLTLLESYRFETIYYETVEPFPFELSEIAEINYPDLLHVNEKNRKLFDQLHSAPWNNPIRLTEQFVIHKIPKDIQNYSSEKKFDLIYFDAFGPDKQPDLWTQEIFDKMYAILLPQGILTTYSAKGTVKRMLLRAGFSIEGLPGPPGKREITRAIKP